MKILLIALLLFQVPTTTQADSGTVTGLIRTEDGKPAVNVRVAAMSAEDPTTNRSESLFGITRSDESGHFRIENIPPGRYHIVAGLVGMPTFYPGTIQATGATAVAIQPGAIVNEINFKVSEESVRPPNFQIAQLLPLLFTDDVGPPTALVHGRIRSENGGVFMSMPIRVVVTTKGTGGPTNEIVQSDGTFNLRLPWGEHNISLELPPGYSVNSITLDSANLLSQPLRIEPRAPFGEIQITLRTPHLKTISGRVVDQSSGASASGATIDLKDSAGKKSQTRSAADGSFEFLGAIPGSYLLDIGLPYYISLHETIVMEDQDIHLDLQIAKP